MHYAWLCKGWGLILLTNSNVKNYLLSEKIKLKRWKNNSVYSLAAFVCMIFVVFLRGGGVKVCGKYVKNRGKDKL